MMMREEVSDGHQGMKMIAKRDFDQGETIFESQPAEEAEREGRSASSSSSSSSSLALRRLDGARYKYLIIAIDQGVSWVEELKREEGQEEGCLLLPLVRVMRRASSSSSVNVRVERIEERGGRYKLVAARSISKGEEMVIDKADE